eukprot:CAMPEP_0195130404 /NCGR_PEP_ID=MMETSP0448-20130528/143200_1 /TAXON_ID=66468 /ORGANISM="Heterocapsa triquestra, Strain CCMP 448" /LENGTH=52 /DNA_ID=CAMNT_0040168313 /DNA_START=100 /DNA_END=255 /DNA_ORIENTATION=-
MMRVYTSSSSPSIGTSLWPPFCAGGGASRTGLSTSSNHFSNTWKNSTCSGLA